MKNPYELYLVLQKKWFLEILKGEKTEEYRDYTEHWVNKLCVLDNDEIVDAKKYDTIRFQLGYREKAPQMVVKCKGVQLESDDDGSDEYTSDNCNFVIHLGEVIERKNCENLLI